MVQNSQESNSGPLSRPFARGEVNDKMAIFAVFSVLDHSELGRVVSTVIFFKQRFFSY